MQNAFDELFVLNPRIQLTPGNHPTPSFEQHIAGTPTRRHHGFAFAARRQEVWDEDARCLVTSESVHPPMLGSEAARAIAARGFGQWLESACAPLLETMYPGYVLGTGKEIEDAMAIGIPLAVDVSHVFIQLAQHAMSNETWQRLSRYEHIHEIHVSANDGARDLHLPLNDSSFGVGWARERGSDTPVVLECYMHRLAPSVRAEQIRRLQGAS